MNITQVNQSVRSFFDKESITYQYDENESYQTFNHLTKYPNVAVSIITDPEEYSADPVHPTIIVSTYYSDDNSYPFQDVFVIKTPEQLDTVLREQIPEFQKVSTHHLDT